LVLEKFREFAKAAAKCLAESQAKNSECDRVASEDNSQDDYGKAGGSPGNSEDRTRGQEMAQSPTQGHQNHKRREAGFPSALEKKEHGRKFSRGLKIRGSSTRG
jgi:hypothetical protein